MPKMDNIKPTEEQQAILDKAIDLLFQFYKDEESQERQSWVHYFVNKDNEEFGTEYDTCSNPKCIEASKKQIRIDNGNRTIINERYTLTGNDCENIPRCSICGKPFEDSLTWIDYEFDHFEDNFPTIPDLKEYPSIPFDLAAIFRSIPSNDYELSGYAKHQHSLGNDIPMKEYLEKQTKLINDVVEYASRIINIIENAKEV